MTEPITPAGGVVTPPATDTSVQNPPAPAATPPVPNVGEPEWLPKRIEQAKKSAEAELLKSLGFATPEEARAAADTARKAADANKSAEQRAVEAESAAKVAKAEAERLTGATKEYAARMLVGLTPEQKSAVTAIAGDDAAKQVTTIAALTPTWAAAATAQQQAADEAAKQVDTAPPAGAPNGKTPAAPDANAQYEALRRQNPFAAAHYGAEHPEVYDSK